jgi:predicted RND superfamily exporter protein
MLHNSRRFFSDWVPDFVIRRAKVILIGAFFLTAGLAAYSVLNFRIDTDFDALVSSDLSSQRSLTDFEKLFPCLHPAAVPSISKTGSSIWA